MSARELVAPADERRFPTRRLPDLVSVGVDVGQKVDPTAVVVCEAVEERTDRKERAWVDPVWVLEPVYEVIFEARSLERLTLGTSYPAVAERLVAIIGGVVDRLEARLKERLLDPEDEGEPWGDATPKALRRRAEQSVQVNVDSTGVGAPVVDLLREALVDLHTPLTAVTFTHGDTFTGAGTREARLGKAYLVSRLQALLQTDRLRLPVTGEAADLKRELDVYEIKVDQDANAKYGAFKVGTHDDLVTALGLACLDDRAGQTVRYIPAPWR